MKIFLDDDPVRDSWVDNTWTIMRDPIACVYLIGNLRPGELEILSLDHDLGYVSGGVERTGYWVLCQIEDRLAHDPSWRNLLPAKFEIHSANSVGRKNMQAAIDSIERMRNRGNV